MDIMFNDEEAIDLILLFYTPFNGVLETDIEEYSGMRKLIENDAVDLNDGWYSLNNKGYIAQFPALVRRTALYDYQLGC